MMNVKRYIFQLTVVLVVATSVAFAQGTGGENTVQPAEIVLRPTIPAYYPGCTNVTEGSDEKANCSAGKLMSYIAQNLTYPDEAREEKIEGVVVLSFVISDSGAVESVKILRDIGMGCGEEASRVVRNMPNWQPAIYKGKNVKTQFSLPITFSLRTGMFDYILHLGDLPDGEIYKKELLETLTTYTPRVTDPKGAEMVVTELVYTFERGGERSEFIVRGAELPDEKKFSKFIGKKPGRLTVEANVVEGLDIRTVTKNFVLVR